MPRRALLYLSILVHVVPGWSRESAPETAPEKPIRPDILLVIADDMDPSHLGFRNPLAHTPNVDRLARKGTVFEQAWMTPRCAPSLASILTGLHPHEHGRFFNYKNLGNGFDTDLSLDVATGFVKPLQDAGYRCFLGGKWWFGDPKVAGFEKADTRAIHFVRRSQQRLLDWLETLGDGENFFVWWAPMLPHTPHETTPSYLKRIDRNAIRAPSHVREEDAAEFVSKEHTLLAMGAWMDDGLGELQERIRSLGRDRNLLTIFCIDNGWSNGLVSKGSLYEKGLQSPIILHHPGCVPVGEVRHQLASVVDLHPTILDYAGIPSPSAPISDGRSLRGLVEGRATEWRDQLIEVEYPARTSSTDWRMEAYAIAVRTDRWKMIRYLQDVDERRNPNLKVKCILTTPLSRSAGSEELFDLSQDPLELNNLVEDPAHAAKRLELGQVLSVWWRENAAETAKPN